jgi:hypothetical protein
MRELALWGARSLGPPTADDELFPGWLVNPVDMILGPLAPAGRFEFRVGDEVASLVDGVAHAGSIDNPDVVIEGDAAGLYYCSSIGGSTASRSRAIAPCSRSCLMPRRSRSSLSNCFDLDEIVGPSVGRGIRAGFPSNRSSSAGRTTCVALGT